MVDLSIVMWLRLPGRVFDFSQIYIMGMWDFIDLTTGFLPRFLSGIFMRFNQQKWSLAMGFKEMLHGSSG